MADHTHETTNMPQDTDDHLAATRLYEPEDLLTRQEENIALAAELLGSGMVNERELAATVSDWSMHGSISLAQHLSQKRVLSDGQVDTLLQSAKTRVDRARQSIAAGSESPEGGNSMLLATLERIDGSGRVAKLFGVTVAARGGVDDARVMKGRYELVRKLGQGGLGRVWLARDVNLRRFVALKEISHATTASEAIIERFKNEAEITGRLDHPSIVPIYQLGEDLDTGRVFYTMRFLGRSTLQDSISEYHERREEDDDDPMLLRHLLTAFVNVCHAIGHAHSRKVIHRDLKPENVVIDNFGQVIVIDWGLAKVIDETSFECLIDSDELGSSNRTNEGQVLGTPLYMAPEQAAGRLDELDHRTDIYGLGAILFAIVTGSAPHEKTQKDAVDSGVGARGMISVIASGVTPLARDANPDADPVLESICRKAMERRRYGRYQAAADLAEDVQRWMAGEPVTAHDETSWQRTSRWIAQHQRLSQALLAIAIVALVALTTLAMSARHSYLAARHARYLELAGDVSELEMQLRGVASELTKDARFLTALPPIQGIINARNGAEGDSEAVWQERLQTIYVSMMRSNPDYLALAYESASGEGSNDVVRVERNPADPSVVRVLPASRLLTVETDTLMNSVSTLGPGDVRLSLNTRTRHVERPNQKDRLSVAAPIFSDAAGNFFGMIVIELDISKRIRDVLLSQGSFNGEIYIADGEGQLLVSADTDEGPQLAGHAERIPNLPAEIEAKLSAGKEPFELNGDNEYVARRMYVDPDGRGVLIFARLLEED